eukprot:TRINITY_DN9410_c0_g1_i2.p1 TRINITY_DN9410_c0_g1~~TRINITY_DN9410_c0_g1_i2.p1  ORF type:complete len:252 (+),score=35.82 TRINITY_DN9410_c0_g1_i2:100-756(+)
MVSVYFFVPNLIGYTRILLAIYGFYVCFSQPLIFLALYAISELLDAVDGHVARALDQSSRFGAVLDMVTDRASTSALLVVLSVLYPKYIYLFMALISLDLISHYAHLSSSLISGATSHKKIRPDQSWFLKLYYHNRFVLFLLCFANEGVFLCAYATHFFPNWPLLTIGSFNISLALASFYLFLPLGFMKQFMNVVQLVQASKDLVAKDVAERKRRKKM